RRRRSSSSSSVRTFGSITTPLPITHSLPGCKMPDGIRCNFQVCPLRTIVWPALLPPWKRTTASARSASMAVTFPFPPSPRWAPTTTIPGIAGNQCTAGVAALGSRNTGRRSMATSTAMDEPPTPGSIGAVVFDIGGVLLDWDPRYLYRKLFDDQVEMERFLDEICTLEWHSAHDLGVPASRSCAELAQIHPEHAELIAAWATRSEEMIGGEFSDVVEMLSALKQAGVPCFALTNMEAETYPLRRERYEFMGWFDGTVVSAHE